MAYKKFKEYGNMRIISAEGKDLFLGKLTTAKKNGKLNPEAFSGLMDESLDTDFLAVIYEKHKSDIGYPYLEDKEYCRALINVAFNYSVKLYEQQGNRFVRYGYTVTEADMADHICVKSVGGENLLVAIEIAYEKDKSYIPVDKPLDKDVLGKYFSYDAEKKVYKRSKTEYLPRKNARIYASTYIRTASILTVFIMFVISEAQVRAEAESAYSS